MKIENMILCKQILKQETSIVLPDSAFMNVTSFLMYHITKTISNYLVILGQAIKIRRKVVAVGLKKGFL